MPEYAVICVGKDNDYGHPTSDVLSRLRDADVKTFRTDMQGDILCVSDGKTVTFTVSKNADANVFGNLK
jgi:competence protein ComEC